jgi:hypothetical protein
MHMAACRAVYDGARMLGVTSLRHDLQHQPHLLARHQPYSAVGFADKNTWIAAQHGVCKLKCSAV